MAKEDIDKSLDGNLSIGKSVDRLHQKRAALYENTINEQFQPKNNIYNHHKNTLMPLVLFYL